MLKPNQRAPPSTESPDAVLRFTSKGNRTSTERGQPTQTHVPQLRSVKVVPVPPVSPIPSPRNPRSALARRFSGVVVQVCGGASPATWQRQRIGKLSVARLYSYRHQYSS